MTKTCNQQKGRNRWDKCVTVQIAESDMRVMFGIVRNLAVPVLTSTSFTDKCINGIFRSGMKIVPFNSPPVAILTVHGTEIDETEEQQSDTLAKIIANQD